MFEGIPTRVSIFVTNKSREYHTTDKNTRTQVQTWHSCFEPRDLLLSRVRGIRALVFERILLSDLMSLFSVSVMSLVWSQQMWLTWKSTLEWTLEDNKKNSTRASRSNTGTCGHAFHEDCLMKTQSPKCPTCKQFFRPKITESYMAYARRCNIYVPSIKNAPQENHSIMTKT